MGVSDQELDERLRSTALYVALQAIAHKKHRPEGYKLTVYDAVRVTWGGVYVHAAPWSVAQQGNSNVSHGCINLSTDNASWYYNQVNVGDG